MNKEESAIKRTAGVYNMIPNLFWSALLLIPVTVFCYSLMDRITFWLFLSISLLAVFLPRNFFNNIQLSSTSGLYKKIGVRFINKFTQNGDIVNKLVRKRYPGYKVVSSKSVDVKRLIGQTYMFEKFHFILFVFFLLAMAYAISIERYGWALFFFISNIVYNVYPSFLQQYIRIRLKVAAKRGE